MPEIPHCNLQGTGDLEMAAGELLVDWPEVGSVGGQDGEAT